MKIRKFIVSLTAGVTTAVAAGYTAMSAFAEEAAEQTANANGQQQASMGSLLTMPLMLVVMFVLLYFMAIRPQKKRDKELKEMVGDGVVTGGGIVGIVVSVGEDTVVIETGGAKHKLRIKNWAITENVTAAERIREAKAAGKQSSTVESAAVVDDDDDKKSKKKDKADE